MANSKIYAEITNGPRVQFRVEIALGEGPQWTVYIWSDKDHGQGMGQGTYPYVVERVAGSGTSTFYRDYGTGLYFPGKYAAELGVAGLGIVDYSLFEVAQGTPQPGGCSGFNVTLSGCPYNVTSGVAVKIPLTITNGTAPFTLEYYLDGVLQNTESNVTCRNCTITVTFNGSGTHRYSVRVIESSSSHCSLFTNDCTINIGGGGCQPPSGQKYCRDDITFCEWRQDICDYVCFECETGKKCIDGNCYIQGGAGYNCVNGNCQSVTSGAQYPDLESCRNACGGGGTPPPSGCTNCNLTYNYCILGNCMSKKNVLYGGIGLIALMMLTRR